MLSVQEMTENIVQAWNALNDADKCKGYAWYPVAHDLAVMLGHGDAKIGAGIIAALSPLKSWQENIKLATDASNGNVHGHFTNAVSKVNAILSGTAPEDVLPMDAKTGNFYLNILDPSNPHPVTIDRHAYRVATGDKISKLRPAQYAQVADAYRNAGAILNIPAPVVQAGVWGPMARQGY